MPQEKVKQTEEGLIFEKTTPITTREFFLLTKAYPIGLSWRPTYGAKLDIELTPPRPSYSVYVRYSPDMKNWSCWHSMQEKHHGWIAVKQAGSNQSYIQLQIPQKERKEYLDYLRQHMKMDVPWGGDEEAVVNWILTQEPDFFEKQIPFMGYIQFLCESSVRDGQFPPKMKVSIKWGVGGLMSGPQDESVFKKRDNIPWRFKASDEKNKPRIE